MHGAATHLFQHLKRFALAYTVLFAALGVTFTGWFYTQRNTEFRDRERFEENVQATRQGMDRRIESYVEILSDLAAVFAYSDHVTLRDFDAFWAHYDIGRKLPGIYLIGYSARVPADRKPQYEAELQRMGFAQREITPAGSRPEYFPATYLYPFDVESSEPNERNAIGMDWYADPARREAMERARDTGQAAASKPIRFFNDTTGRSATIVYYPLYKNGLFLNNAEDRRAALSGFVFIAFYTRDLFSDITGSGKGHTVDYQVFDNSQSDGIDLLQDASKAAQVPDADVAPRFHKTVQLSGAQRQWRAHFYTLPGFDQKSGVNFPRYVLGAGAAISLMLFGIVVLISRTMAARRMAEEAIRFSEILKENEQRLAYLAQYDSLTGLPNRHLFLDRLSQAMSRAISDNGSGALMFIDLDRFKEINDHLGHHTGDLILKLAAQRIKNCSSDHDTVARLGGDEFTIILESLHDMQHATAVARKILDAFSHPFIFDGMEFLLTASIGITFFPGDAQSIEGILKCADMAMYEAKNAGRNDYKLFSPEMDVVATERIHLKNHLQHALARNELFLHYQPQIDLASGATVGVEALLRWKHPELGMVSPAKFISLAEETGLIVSLGEWVLRTAAQQCAAWQRQGLPSLKVAVNVSARQLRQENFAEMVAAILHETGVRPELIELEITEGLIIENIRYSRTVLAKLRQMGMPIALDDFGTGYSSLSYLKNLPLDMLKMDGSFVRHLASESAEAENSRAIAQTIITLGHSLNLKVIAEGVETNEQLAYLRAAGCDQMQGYLFSRPVDADRIVELIRQKAFT